MDILRTKNNLEVKAKIRHIECPYSRPSYDRPERIIYFNYSLSIETPEGERIGLGKNYDLLLDPEA